MKIKKERKKNTFKVHKEMQKYQQQFLFRYPWTGCHCLMLIYITNSQFQLNQKRVGDFENNNLQKLIS